MCSASVRTFLAAKQYILGYPCARDETDDDQGPNEGSNEVAPPDDADDVQGPPPVPGLRVTVNELYGAMPRAQAFARITAVGNEAACIIPPISMTPLAQWHETRMTPASNELILEVCYYATGGYLNTQLRVAIIENEMRLFPDVAWLIRAARNDPNDTGSLTISLRHRNGLNL